MKQVFGFTRFLIILGVITSLALSAVIFLVSVAEVFTIVVHLVSVLGQEDALKETTISAIHLADNALIAAALYIIAAGLYGLFIGRADLPAWLIVQTFDELKEKLVGVSVTVLAVTFVEYVATWDGQSDLLTVGLAIGAVIVAISLFSFLTHRSGRDHGEKQ